MKRLALGALLLWLVCTPVQAQVPTTQLSVPINAVTAPTQLVAAAQGQWIYATAVLLIGAATVQFYYGTGATCGTGTTPITGAMAMTAGLTFGNGGGAVWVVPPGNALCMTSSAAVNGSLAYARR